MADDDDVPEGSTATTTPTINSPPPSNNTTAMIDTPGDGGSTTGLLSLTPSNLSSAGYSANHKSSSSVSKTMARLLALPANRSCADCRVTLVDSSQVYASYSQGAEQDDYYAWRRRKRILQAEQNKQEEAGPETAPPSHDISSDNDNNNRMSLFSGLHAQFTPPGYTPSAVVNEEEEEGQEMEQEENDPENDPEHGDDPQNDNPNNLPVLEEKKESAATETMEDEHGPNPTRSIISTFNAEMALDPAKCIAQRSLGHGVFICAMCAAAHQLLMVTTTAAHADTISEDHSHSNSQHQQQSFENNHSSENDNKDDLMDFDNQQNNDNIDDHTAIPSATVVFSVKDPTAWNAQNVAVLAATGNAESNQRLEAYYHHNQGNNAIANQQRRTKYSVRRPKVNASIAQRFTFVCAKYKALAFCLPPIYVPRQQLNDNATAPVSPQIAHSNITVADNFGSNNGNNNNMASTPHLANQAWQQIVQRHQDREWKYWLRQTSASSNNNNNYNNTPAITNSFRLEPQPSRNPLVGPISELELYHNHERNTGKNHNNSLLASASNPPALQTAVSMSEAGLPNRLVDYFCVISTGSAAATTSDDKNNAPESCATNPTRLDPRFCHELNNNGSTPLKQAVKRVQDLLLEPKITDCYPDPNTHASSMEFPQHVASFVFPEGCRPSSHATSPEFFTFTLTCSDGSRLYGGALKLHDRTMDMEALREVCIQSMGYDEHDVDQLQKVLPSWLNVDQHGVHIIEEEDQEDDEGGFNLSLDDEMDDQFDERMVHSDIAYLPKCLVVLSHYPFFDLWRKFLLQIYRIALVEAPLPIERFVTNFVSEVPLPPPGKVEVRFGFTAHEMWSIRRPPNNELPLVDFSYQPLFATLSVSSVMVVVACLLEETRVALLSKHYALLTPTAEALCSLLFPFHWQGMYIPIMPYSMLDILDAPVPFLVGLHSRYLQETPPERRPRGVVFVDLDNDVVHLGWNDDGGAAMFGEAAAEQRTTPALPEKDALKLKNRLAASASSVFIVPDSGKAGSITYGNEQPLPFTDRDSYSYINSSEVPNTIQSVRRKEACGMVDRAYNDNEMYIPIEDFLSGQGVFHERKTVKPNTSSTRSNNRLKFMRRLMPSPIRPGGGRFLGRGVTRGGSNSNVVAGSPEDDEVSVVSSIPSTSNTPIHDLLEMNEPAGFSVEEIRTAFLKFFVGILKNYRQFVNEEDKTFDSELFLASMTALPERSKVYLEGVFQTQMFERFIQERIECPADAEVLFFDTSINAKNNKFQKSAPFKNTFRKKDTSFLDDKSKQVTEKYTPPPPSNSGLPDDGRTYHYGSFPELDKSLFGKARKPIVWPEFQSKGSTRALRRTDSEIIRKQQLLMDGLLGKSTTGLLATSSNREPSLLEQSLYSLSKPFMAERTKPPLKPDVTRRSPPTSPAGTAPAGNSFDDGDDLSPEAAQEVILSARRKVSILVAIFVGLQARARGYLVREKGRIEVKNEEEEVKAKWYQAKISKHEPALAIFQQMAQRWLARKTKERQTDAATKVQAFVRCIQQHKKFMRFRYTIVILQATIRCRRTQFAYGLLLRSISKVKAMYRAYRVRKSIRKLLSARQKAYRRQIFILWKREHTSLAYRTKLWTILKKSSFMRHNIAETELRRLWNELQLIEDPDLADAGTDRVAKLSAKLGVSSDTYAACIGFNDNLDDDQEDDFSNVSSLGSVSMSSKSYSISSPTSANNRGTGVSLLLSSERTQIYERLSRTSTLNNSQVMKHYDMFKIGAREKKRKKALAEAVWRNIDQVDASASLMYELFPELEFSDKLQFVEPSKKGMRRFHFDFKPVESESTLLAQKMFDDRVRRNVAVVASIAICKVPSLMDRMKPVSTSLERRQIACMQAFGFQTWPVCRVQLMKSLARNELLGQPNL